MTIIYVSNNRLNSPNQALSSPNRNRKSILIADIQYVTYLLKFSKNSIEFSKGSEGQVSFNSLYRASGSLKMKK